MQKKVMVIDYKYCTGCMSCVLSCRNEKGISLDEWGINVMESGPVKIGGDWHWNYIPVLSKLCDLCEERVGGGEKPPCVIHCMAACMDVIDIEELPLKLDELGAGALCYTR